MNAYGIISGIYEPIAKLMRGNFLPHSHTRSFAIGSYETAKMGLIMSTTLPRITARVDEETQSLLTRASALVGITNINSFVLNAAVEKAKDIMLREQSLNLSRQDAMRLVNALEEPAKKHPRMQQAVERFASKHQASSGQ